MAPSPSQPLRILMTADAVGGVWTYALDLCRALGESGVSVLLATMGDQPSASQLSCVQALSNVRLEVSHYKLEWMDEPWADVSDAGRWLRGLARAFRPDLVHLNGYVHGNIDFGMPVVCVAHSCCLSWWEAVKGEPPPPFWATYQTAVRAGLAGADAVVAPTRSMLQCIDRHYGKPANGRVIYNGSNPSRGAAQDKEPFVLSAGRMWDEAKNLCALAAAANGVHWPVRVAGPVRVASPVCVDRPVNIAEPATSPDGRQLDGPHVELLGRLSPETLAGHMARASIYALPAKYEPFGLSVLEAALSGCALVLGDIASLREVWGEAALYVDPSDVAGLRETINLLITQPQLRQNFAHRARLRAARYSTARQAQAYLTLYRQLLSGPALEQDLPMLSSLPL